MRHYEITFLVHPDQSEQVPAMIDRYKDMVTSGQGNIHRVEDWGRRRLAYMINDVYKAHYVMLNIECNLDVLGEIENNFKFNDSILRHLVIRRKEAITEASPIAQDKQREEEKEVEEATRQQASATASSDEGGDKEEPDDGAAEEIGHDEVEHDEEPAESDDTVLDEDALLDEYALEEDALEDEAIKDAALKDGGIV